MPASEYAVLAKVRAMYAHRLTPEQYRAMLNCRTAGEVAAYLKEKTPYGPYMQSAAPAAVHRGWLESRLREAQYRSFEALAFYAYAVHAPIYRYFITQRETELLYRSLSALGRPAADEWPDASPFFEKHSAVNWPAVARAADLRAWHAALKGTPYHALCLPFLHTDTGAVDMAGLSHALSHHQMQLLRALADASPNRKERQALTALLRLHTDMSNIAVIYRLGVLRQQDTAAEAAVEEGGSLTGPQLRRLIAARNDDAFAAALERTRYRDVAGWRQDGYIELALSRLSCRAHRHQLRFTPYPSVAVLCYISLQQLELSNIIHVIEGVRYGAADKVAGLLVGVDGFSPDGSAAGRI